MRITNETIRIPSETMKSEFIRLEKYGSSVKAENVGISLHLTVLKVFIHTSQQVSRFVKNVAGGILPDAEPTLVHSKDLLSSGTAI